jgi:hypothetical protein
MLNVLKLDAMLGDRLFSGLAGFRRQTLQNARHNRLFFDSSLVNQHHGNVVAYRIDTMTLNTLQAALIGFEFHRRPANGASKDRQQFFVDSHGDSSVKSLLLNSSEQPEEVCDHEAGEGQEVEGSESGCKSFVVAGQAAETGGPGEAFLPLPTFAVAGRSRVWPRYV